MAQLDWESNSEIDISMLTEGSATIVGWICEKEHKWKATISSRSTGRGCPYCANKKILVGYNDLKTTNPTLANEWHPSFNGDLKPSDISKNSHQKVFWLCSLGHSYEATVSKRNNGSNCPICANQKILPGYNDLATINPQLASEWDVIKNRNLTPKNVATGTNRRVYWLCKKGHSWQATIASRNSGVGCPICSNRVVLKGYNDFASTNPELVNEWHPTKNGKLTPYDVVSGSGIKVWWKCSKGHEWQTTVDKRRSGTGCPICKNETRTSFPEQAIYYYISKLIPVENRSIVFGKEIDIYIPDWRIGIEYDGLFFHNSEKSLERESIKDKHLKKHNIEIIRIKESDKFDVDSIKSFPIFRTIETVKVPLHLVSGASN